MFNLLLIIFILVSTPAFAVTNWNKAIPSSGDSKSSWPGQVTAQWSIMDTLLSNYRRGEKLFFKNSTTLTVAAGEVVVSNSGGSLRLFLQDASTTDITSANLDSGASFSAGTTYYVYAATSSSTASSSTYYISASSSAPTGPTYYAQLGSFTTDGSANIVSNKVYSSAYGPINADASGQPEIQAIYDYSTSSSSSTFRTGGLKIAYGSVSVSNNSSQSITNLPFTSSTTYSMTVSYSTSSSSITQNPGVVISSGSSATIYNSDGSTRSINWIAIGT
jgi:hypothetical protein